MFGETDPSKVPETLNPGELQPKAASVAVLLFAAFLLLVLFLAGFLLTCKLRAKKGPNYDDLA